MICTGYRISSCTLSFGSEEEPLYGGYSRWEMRLVDTESEAQPNIVTGADMFSDIHSNRYMAQAIAG